MLVSNLGSEHWHPFEKGDKAALCEAMVKTALSGAGPRNKERFHFSALGGSVHIQAE